MTVPRARHPAAALISVVVPVFNEAAVLPLLVDALRAALGPEGWRFEMIFVDDGSTDGSGQLLDELAAGDRRVRVLHLSRNFGQQAAVHAGLSRARGDAVIVMDADLQDDPDALGALLAKWREGYDVVYALRVARKEAAPKRALFALCHRILRHITVPPLPADAGNFGLIDGAVAAAIKDLPDRDRYFPGLRRWVGFAQTGVAVARRPRYDSHPRVSLRGLWRLAKTAAFSFSSMPLSIFYGIFAASVVAFLGLLGFTGYHKVVTGKAIPGWTSTIMVACFFGALNALGISILGEYIVRIYDQVRGRPVFVVARAVNFSREDGEPSP